jgi:hypothetical protein
MPQIVSIPIRQKLPTEVCNDGKEPISSRLGFEKTPLQTTRSHKLLARIERPALFLTYFVGFTIVW